MPGELVVDDWGLTSDERVMFTVTVISCALFGGVYGLIYLWVACSATGGCRQGDIPIRELLVAVMQNTAIGGGFNIFDAAYSIMSCIFFVWDTYLSATPLWMFSMELHFSVFFLFNYLFSFYVAKPRISHIWYMSGCGPLPLMTEI